MYIDVIPILKTSKILRSLSDNELIEVSKSVEIVHAHKDTLLIKEDSISSEMYFVAEGLIGLQQYDDELKENVTFKQSQKGDMIGEIGFFDLGQRSCSAIAETDSVLLLLRVEKLLAQHHGNNIYDKMKNEVLSLLIKHIKSSNANQISQLKSEITYRKMQEHFGRIFLSVIIIFTIATIVNQLNYQYKVIDIYSVFFNWVYLILVSAPIMVVVLISNYPLSMFGITLLNWKQSTLEGIVFSLILSIAFMLFVYIYTPDASELAVFGKLYQSIGISSTLYFVHAFLQELIARGILLTSVIQFLGEEFYFRSVVISALLFSLLHIQYGFTAIAMTFFFGIFLGYIYLKHKNLIGVTMIHSIVGLIVINSIGL